MWILVLLLLLLAAQQNLTAIVPLLPGDPPPPWWVGGRILWPFATETRTLIPPGDLLNALTPALAVVSALCFILAALALLRWLVPARWFRPLIVVGAILAIVLQVIWFSVWAILPLIVAAVLLWLALGRRVTVEGLRGPRRA